MPVNLWKAERLKLPKDHENQVTAGYHEGPHSGSEGPKSGKKGKISNTSKRVQILIRVNFGYQQLIKNDKNFVSFDFSCPNKIKLLNDI